MIVEKRITTKTQAVHIKDTKRLMFPAIHQLIVSAKDVPYGYSLFIGLTTPLVNLPVMIWLSLIYPFLCGLREIVLFTVACVVAGIGGRADGRDIPKGTLLLGGPAPKKND